VASGAAALVAASGNLKSFDHLVGATEQQQRHGHAKLLVNSGTDFSATNRLLARARRQPDAVYEIEERAMLAISSATQSIQEDYIRGQGQLILPGAEVIGRRIIGMLVSELGPK
jgi:hypothetical protein